MFSCILHLVELEIWFHWFGLGWRFGWVGLEIWFFWRLGSAGLGRDGNLVKLGCAKLGSTDDLVRLEIWLGWAGLVWG